MSAVIQKLVYYFEYPFVWYALIVGILIALCSALLGVILVLKRFSFIGDGLSHVAFGAISIATVLNLSNSIFITIPVTVLSAILLLHAGQKMKMKGDAAIAMLSVSSLAVGYLLMNLFSASSNLAADVCTTLFGSTSILTLRSTDVYVCIGLSIFVLVIFTLFYHKIFAVTFDEDFTTAIGIKSNQYTLLIAIITALVVVLAINLVGSLLISALVIFPALSAMRVFKSFKSVIVCSVIISIINSTLGLLLSILVGTPVGSTIVVVHLVCFGLFSFCAVISGGRK